MKFIFLFLYVSLLSCCRSVDNCRFGKVMIKYANEIAIGGEEVSLNNAEISKVREDIEKSDSMTIRFMSVFEHERVTIFDESNNVIKEFSDITTNGSIGTAEIYYRIRKQSSVRILLRGLCYDIPISTNFRFVDIYFDKDKGQMRVEFNNNILVLS